MSIDSDPLPSLSPDELGGRTTFIIVRLEPGTDALRVVREIRRRLPYNDVYTSNEWAARSRVTEVLQTE